MRVLNPLVFSIILLMPLQAMAQSGSVGGSGSGTASVTTGTAGSTTGAPTMPGPPGTNSLGTAQSSGGVTTGLAGGSKAEDDKIQEENRKTDQKLKGICKGC